MKYFLLIIALLLISCSGSEETEPGKKGEKCDTSTPCVEGLYCINDKCQTQNDACKNVTCLNHGICEIRDNRAICKCDAGYEVSPNGYMCTLGSPCSGVDCSGHGTCSEQTGEAKCTCEAGYVPVFDINCVSKDNPCEGVNCKNGECVIAGGTPTCSCNEGYEFDGSECVKEIDICEGLTCSGHGECIESYGEATCKCDKGYTQGDNYTCVKNPCDPNPCKEMEGTDIQHSCSVVNDNYVCTCDVSSSYEWNDAKRKCVKDTSENKCEDSHAHKDSSGNCICNESYKADPNSTPQKPNNIDLICIPENDDPCANNPCAGFPNKECKATDSSYECVCKNGYKENNAVEQKCIPNGCNENTCTEDYKTICEYDENNTIKCFCDPGYEEDASGVCKLKSGCNPNSCKGANMTGDCQGNPLSDSGIYCQCKPGFIGENCEEAGDNWCCMELNANGKCDNPCEFVNHSTKECYAMGLGSFCQCESGFEFSESGSGSECIPEQN